MTWPLGFHPPVSLGIGLSPSEGNRLLQVLATYLCNDTGHRDDVAFARELHEQVQAWLVNHQQLQPEPNGARFYLRFIYLDGPIEGTMAPGIGGPYAERGEAEDIAAWLNRRASGRVYYYATTRSPLEL